MSQLEAAVEAVRRVTGELDAHLKHDQELPLEANVRLLRSLHAAVVSLRQSESALETRIADIWDRENHRHPVAIAGVGKVEVRRTAERKQWEHDQLAHACLASLIESRGGEVPSPFEVRDHLMSAVGVSYWRTGALRDMGIDPDEYCHRQPGTRRVIVT